MVDPFFPTTKWAHRQFLGTINVGTGTTPPSLVPLGRRKPSGSTSTDDAFPDDGASSWICPAISPRSTGLACPVALYGEKTVPPKRSERRITPRRRHRRAPNSGPNHRRSLRRQRRRTPQPELPVRVFFKQSKRLRCLIEWPLPSHRSVLTVPEHNGSVRLAVISTPPSIDLTTDDDSNVGGDIEFDDESDVGRDIEFGIEQRVEYDDNTEDNSDSRDSASVPASSEKFGPTSTTIRPRIKPKTTSRNLLLATCSRKMHTVYDGEHATAMDTYFQTHLLTTCDTNTS